MKNDFSVDTSKNINNDFMRKVKGPMNIALLLTGIQTLCAIIYVIGGIGNIVWKNEGAEVFFAGLVRYLPMVCIFASLVIMLVSEKAFTKTLFVCMRIIAVIYGVESLLLPRLEGYESGFEILNLGDGPLFDGYMITVAVVLFVLSVIIKEGLVFQKEIEEIL